MLDRWKPTFKDAPSKISVKFESKIVPVIGSSFDYSLLDNKPQINGVVLQGNKSNEDLNINSISNEEIERILKTFVL